MNQDGINIVKHAEILKEFFNTSTSLKTTKFSYKSIKTVQKKNAFCYKNGYFAQRHMKVKKAQESNQALFCVAHLPCKKILGYILMKTFFTT